MNVNPVRSIEDQVFFVKVSFQHFPGGIGGYHGEQIKKSEVNKDIMKGELQKDHGGKTGNNMPPQPPCVEAHVKRDLVFESGKLFQLFPVIDHEKCENHGKTNQRIDEYVSPAVSAKEVGEQGYPFLVKKITRCNDKDADHQEIEEDLLKGLMWNDL
jgi:hypothetical protein